MDRRIKGRPVRIAVLGGGMSSLTALFRLTSESGWQEQYDITLYQAGWRLGGKGASGRNPENAFRIEEHGLHLWFGCYQNAFNLIRDCYDQLGRKPEQVLATWKSAFEPAGFVSLHEEINGESLQWPLHFPFTSEDPGGNDPIPTVWENVTHMIRILVERYLEGVVAFTFRPAGELKEEEKEFYNEFNARLTDYLRDLSKMFGIDMSSGNISDALKFMNNFLDDALKSGEYEILLSVADEIRIWFWEQIEDVVYRFHGVRRMWILFDLTIATMTGVIKNRLQYRGLNAINHLDFREWISPFCQTPELTAWSAPIQAMYSLIFCGRDKHSFEAGTCLRCIFRVALNYKGAFYYRMQAGMGDAVFTPMYEVLKERGVKFRFFHQVTSLHLSDDRSEVASIRIREQAKIKNGEYQPLINVKGLSCWPSRPVWDQISGGRQLAESGIDFERFHEKIPGAGEFVLHKGRDFDEILFGISLGAIPLVASELVSANQNWEDMVSHVKTTPTQALQVWLKSDISGTGWPLEKFGKPLVGNFPGKFDTYADLSNLLLRESWPEGEDAGHAAYFCGMLEDVESGNRSDDAIRANAHAKVKIEAEHFISRDAVKIWPRIRNEDGSFNHGMLADAQSRTGTERIDSLYIRANVEPTERYVLAVAGNSKYRIRPGESGFSNLVICGDWTDNGFNAGCIEATVISGLQAARAISGTSAEIAGETDAVDKEPTVLLEN